MRKIITADCETDPFEHGKVPGPFIWDAYDGAKHYTFTHTDDFFHWANKQKAIIYAHNGGKFDWHFLAHKFGHFQEIKVINGRMASFKFGDAEFRDSYSILPVPLSAYKKDDFEYWKNKEQYRLKYWDEITRYLHKDTEYLYEIVIRFINEYGPKLTLAGAAVAQAFSFPSLKPKKQRYNERLYDKMSGYYYGGRVECWETGIIRDDIKVIDIKSAYPTAMKHEHPWGSKTRVYTKNIKPEDVRDTDFVIVRGYSNGAFPKRLDKLRFPQAIGQYDVTGWEFNAAMRTGTIRNPQVTKLTRFEDSINFTPYVDKFFSLKQIAEAAEDAAGRLIAKLFLNSLYGKMACDPRAYSEYIFMPYSYIQPAQIVDGWQYACDYNKQVALCHRPLEEYKQVFYNLATAASITGCVRAMMLEAKAQIKRPLYCDTDSFILVGDLPDTLDFSGGLGSWEVEVHDGTMAAIAGKKLYCVFDKKMKKRKLASKGVRLTPGEIYRIAKGETVNYKFDAPSFSISNPPHFIERSIKLVA